MPNPHTYHSGKNAKAFAGTATANVELDLISWSVTPGVEIVRFRTSLTGNFTEKETTFQDCSFTVVTEHNFQASPYGTTGGGLSLNTPGTNAVKLYLNGTTGAAWNFPQAVLVGNPQNVVVDGKIGTQFNFENSGPWTEPTSSP